jgi:molybdate/tungstate transport system substrate-binding protein
MQAPRPLIALLLPVTAIILSACSPSGRSQVDQEKTLHIIHAGSLSLPVKEISKAFMEENPGTRILTEAWGSKAGARRVMELDTPCDVFLSADYMVIEHMLIPDHASWYLPFAANEMAIVYTANSRYAEEIQVDNWYEILLRPDVRIGRSDPDHDPCGVRTVFTAKLAGLYYGDDRLAPSLLDKNPGNIRPKETDLVALLESRHIDYIFLYRSVASQHGLPYLTLPPELNLGDARFSSWYARVSTTTQGATPGSLLEETGQPMIYGLTIPHKARNKELAEGFAAFVLDPYRGQKIMEEMGQPPVPLEANPYHPLIPERLRQYALP